MEKIENIAGDCRQALAWMAADFSQAFYADMAYCIDAQPSMPAGAMKRDQLSFGERAEYIAGAHSLRD